MSPKPQIKSFLIADMVIQEQGTYKWSAIGIFDRIYSKNFPCVHANMALYVKLADALGDYDVRVEFCDANMQKLSVFQGVKINVADKLSAPECGIQTKNLIIPRPGKYTFDLYCNDQHCGSLPLFVEQLK